MYHRLDLQHSSVNLGTHASFHSINILASASALLWCHVESDVWLQRAWIIFCKGVGEGSKQAGERSTGRCVDKTTFPSSLCDLQREKRPTLMFRVSGGAFSDAAAQAAKSFRRFTAILFKGRRKLEFKVTALKVGFPLSSEAFTLPHPTPGCQKWAALWPCLRPNLWAAVIISPCDGPAVTTAFRLCAWNSFSGLIMDCVYNWGCYF